MFWAAEERSPVIAEQIISLENVQQSIWLTSRTQYAERRMIFDVEINDGNVTIQGLGAGTDAFVPQIMIEQQCCRVAMCETECELSSLDLE